MGKIHILPLFSGSKGNSVLVISSEAKILVDVGVSQIRIEHKLNDFGYTLKDIDAILLTHAHSDHVKGLDIVMKRANAKLYAKADCLAMLSKYTKDIDESRISLVTGEFQIADLSIRPFALPHDMACTGYAFQSQDDKFSFLTDLGEFDEKLFDIIAKSSRVYIECNHDVDMLLNGCYPYPLKMRILSKNGHLSNQACANVCRKLYSFGTRDFVLGHLSEENNLPELAYSVVDEALRENANKCDYVIHVAGRCGLDDIL
ncbi:MAG: MBL fold metallo-hydrolase [Clostridia bacterium]